MIQLIIISAYLAILLALGLCANRMFKGTSKDYMLASHSIGPFLLLMSLFGTTMTAFALVGSSGEAYKEGIGVYGMLASSSGIIHSFCFFIVGVKLWALGRKHGFTTQIQFFRTRLENDGIGILLFPILVGLVIPYLLIGVMASGTVIQNVTQGTFPESFTALAYCDYGVPKAIGSAVICGVVLLYVFFGGMRGTAWANAAQTVVFMILGLVTFFLIAGKLGTAERDYLKSVLKKGPADDSQAEKAKHAEYEEMVKKSDLELASFAVVDKHRVNHPTRPSHPSKMMRTVTEPEEARFENTLHRWQAFAKYAYVEKHHPDQLSSLPAAKIEAIRAKIDKAPAPGWKKPTIKTMAVAQVAQKAGALDLSKEETLLAYLEQDDRVAPSPDDRQDGWEAKPLASFPRDGAWPKNAMQTFGKSIAHPDVTKKDKSKMTRLQALGRYRALNWAPQEAHSMSMLKFFTYLLIPLSVGMFPHLFQHWLTAKSAGSFKLPIVAHPIFIMIVWVPCVLVGVWATSAAMPNNPNVALVPPHFNPNGVLAYMVNLLTDDVLTGFLTAGILAAI
ncbi:MAG: hypothetical protein N2C14_21150, partial [Planctomycetales bacterium]